MIRPMGTFILSGPRDTLHQQEGCLLPLPFQRGEGRGEGSLSRSPSCGPLSNAFSVLSSGCGPGASGSPNSPPLDPATLDFG